MTRKKTKILKSKKILQSQKIISILGKKKEIQLLRIKHARTFSERFMGLMGVSPREHDYALLFHMREESALGASIHMLFMRMPIDVIWLNAKKEVVDFQTLHPWMWNYTPRAKAKYVIELPARTLNEKTPFGMRVDWK